MADTKISNLTALSLPVQASDELVIARAGTTRKVTAADLSDPYAIEPAAEPPSSAHSKDDEFTGSSLDVKWSWVNQSTRLAIVGSGRLKLYCTATAATSTGGVIQNAPTGDFTATTKMTILPTGIHGIVIAVSGGNQIIFGYDTYTYRIWRMNSSGGWVSTIQDGTAAGYPPYLRIRKSGTTVYFEASNNGLDWFTFNSTTVGAGQHVTSLDKVGLVMSGSVGHDTAFDFFRVTEP
jgi:hypothetical protein